MIGVLAFLALAAAQNSNFSESFYVGQDVDVSQGFYDCGSPSAARNAQHIVAERDQAKRHVLARRLGCPYRTAPVRQIRTVVGIDGSMCGPLIKVNGGVMCGAEAHVLRVRDNAGAESAIIFVADDYTFD